MKFGTGKEVVLVISDTHAPFQHRDTLKFLEAVADKWQPTQIVHIGDGLDFHALSDYDSDPDGNSPGIEYEEGLEFMHELYKLFPCATALVGNHDERAHKRARKAQIPSRMISTYPVLYDAPATWDWQDTIMIDDVLYVHGDKVPSNGGNIMQNAVRTYMKSVVFGHFHTRYGIDYYSTSDALLFGMTVGCLIDSASYAFKYTDRQVRRQLIGTGVVDKGLPQLEPMWLTKKGRWLGKL